MEESVFNRLGGMHLSPLKEITGSLSRTPKGQIVYERGPLSPVLDFEGSSGLMLSDGVFKRNPLLVFERSFEETPTLQKIHQARSVLTSTTDINPTKRWQTELVLRRDFSVLDETTPVYNVSHQTLMAWFEARDNEQPPVATSFKKKMEEFEQASRRAAEEDCQRMKRELEQRLVPTTETHIDVERNMQRLQQEAEMQRKLQADQIEKKLLDLQRSQQEHEQKEELKRKLLEQQKAEIRKKKEACVDKVESSWRKISESINSCLERDTFLSALQGKLNQVKATKQQFESTLEDDRLMDRTESIAREIEELTATLYLDIERHNTAAKERAATIAQPFLQEVARAPSPKKEEVRSSNVPDEYVHKDDLQTYLHLQSELAEYERMSKTISSNESLKAFRFDLQKATLSPMNEISDRSGQHLQDKLDRLRNLLLGNMVEAGTKKISASQHPDGIAYCLNLLARRLVQQGEDQVNVNPQAAFPIAAIITELWLEFPVLGRLILAHFYNQCPFLVPYYIPQKDGQSNEDYYRSLGYKYSAGKVELQPAYLKRMSGVVRLYAAIMIYPTRRGQPHPYGLDQAWRFLAALLNLPPRNDITAGVLEVFLKVVGYAMRKEYGRQFDKLLHYICTVYFEKIRSVTPEGSGGGPAFRLEDFLQSSIKSGGIAPPPGQLPPRFW
nr:EOG090X0755 [Eurycercus lamellatus]